MISKVLMKMGAMGRARGVLYTAVAQTVLQYGSNSWVVTGEMLKVLEGFHHWAACRITGITDWCTEDRECDYPPVDDALEAVGLWPIKEYI